jgi:hypothetical protein
VDAIERWEHLREDVALNGYSYKSISEGAGRRKGKNADVEPEDLIQRPRPEVKLLMEAATMMRHWLQEFGLTDITFAKAPKKSQSTRDHMNDPLSSYGLSN